MHGTVGQSYVVFPSFWTVLDVPLELDLLPYLGSIPRHDCHDWVSDSLGWEYPF